MHQYDIITMGNYCRLWKQTIRNNHNKYNNDFNECRVNFVKVDIWSYFCEHLLSKDIAEFC